MPRHDPVPPRRAPGPPPREAAGAPVATAYAWARYRRIMRLMAVLSALCAVAALVWLRWSGAPMRMHMVIATAIGVFLTVLVGTGLMSLAFLSSGSGHDARAAERFERE